MRPLTYPPNAEHDEDSLEVLRGWVIDGELEVAIAPWAWKNQPKQWGRLLADAAAHMADAIAKETGQERSEFTGLSWTRPAIISIILHQIGKAILSMIHPQSSNQAMQRTAGRSAFELSMTSTLTLQPRSPSPAVADLESR